MNLDSVSPRMIDSITSFGDSVVSDSTKAATRQEAAASTAENKKTASGGLTLPDPGQTIGGKNLKKAKEELFDRENVLTLIIALLKLSVLSRDASRDIRDLQNKVQIDQLQAQVDEKKKQGKLEAISAGLSAFATAITAGVGVANAVKAAKQLPIQKALDDKIAGREVKMNKISNEMDSGKLKPADKLVKQNELDELSKMQAIDVRNSKALEKKFELFTQRNQVVSSTLQSADKMGTLSIHSSSITSQAAEKEAEAEAAKASHEKQKSEDHMANSENLRRDLLQIFNQIAQSDSQAYRAAANAV